MPTYEQMQEQYAEQRRTLNYSTEQEALMNWDLRPETTPQYVRTHYTEIHTRSDCHEAVARDMAMKQFDRSPTPFPGGDDIAARFPGIDPAGKHSKGEMEMAERIANLRGFLQTTDPGTKHMCEQALQKLEPPYKQGSSLESTLTSANIEFYQQGIAERACKLVKDPDAYARLSSDADRQGRGIQRLDALLEGIEHMSGLYPGNPSDRVRRIYQEEMMTPYPDNLVRSLREVDVAPVSMSVDFQNIEHSLLQSQLADANNWNKSTKELKAMPMNTGAVDAQLTPYAQATGMRVMGEVYEKFRNTDIPMQDVVIVGGKTVAQHMSEADFNPIARSPQETQDFTNTLITSALMAGKRVDAYIPDHRGNIPHEPTQIVKSGYEPSPLKKVMLNGWERFFNKHGGFFKDKAREVEEYENAQAARTAIETNYSDKMYAFKGEPSFAHNPANAKKVGEIMDRVADFRSKVDKMKEPMEDLDQACFGRDYRKNNPLTAGEQSFHVDRTFGRSLAVGQLLKQGVTPEELADPSAKLDVKRAVGEEVRARLDVGDVDWVAKACLDGARLTADAVDAQYRKLGTKNLNEPSMDKAPLAIVGAAAFDINQEYKRSAVNARLGQICTQPELDVMENRTRAANVHMNLISTQAKDYENIAKAMMSGDQAGAHYYGNTVALQGVGKLIADQLDQKKSPCSLPGRAMENMALAAGMEDGLISICQQANALGRGNELQASVLAGRFSKEFKVDPKLEKFNGEDIFTPQLSRGSSATVKGLTQKDYDKHLNKQQSALDGAKAERERATNSARERNTQRRNESFGRGGPRR